MADLEQEARQAAEERYPNRGDRATIRNARREAFEKGYIAGATRPVTDAEVRAAWEAYIAAQERDPYDRESRMRAALEAARTAREETNHG